MVVTVTLSQPVDVSSRKKIKTKFLLLREKISWILLYFEKGGFLREGPNKTDFVKGRVGFQF